MTWAEVHALLGLTTDIGEEPGFIAPRFNAAPTQMLPVAVERDSERLLEPMRWGLVPAWAAGKAGRLMDAGFINARSETVAEKPAFREALRQRRCLVPASGFYEWKWSAARGEHKQPHYIHLRSGEGFAMAGLWEGHGAAASFTILTTRANEVVGALHDRMPVILPRGSYGRWLGAGDGSDLGDLLEPLEAELMAAYPVSGRVGRMANDDAGLIEPIEPCEMGLFGGP